MATDWASDVRKYAPQADDGVIAGIVRYCGIALQKVDSSLVAFSDPKELARVRNNFLKKKCALAHDDAELDAAIAAVGELMKADRTKNRVTVYYLLAERFGVTGLFVKAAKATAKVATVSMPVEKVAKPNTTPTDTPPAKAKAPKAIAAKAVPTKAAIEKVSVASALPVAPATPVISPDSVARLAKPIESPAAAPMVQALGGAGAAGVAPSLLGHWSGRSSPLGQHLGLLGDGGAAKEIALFFRASMVLLIVTLAWFLLFHR